MSSRMSLRNSNRFLSFEGSNTLCSGGSVALRLGGSSALHLGGSAASVAWRGNVKEKIKW